MARAFAGPLCRFHAGAGGDAAARVAGVQAWRADLVASLAGRLPAALDWDENPDTPGFTAELGDAGWLALRLFAFYAEHSELELPDTVPALLELDRDYRKAAAAKFATSRFGHLLACRAWLPADFPFTFRANLPDGEPAEVGSLSVLVDQLRRLNQGTFQAEAAGIAQWEALPAAMGGPLLPAAQRGFAGLWAAAVVAMQRGQPLVVQER